MRNLFLIICTSICLLLLSACNDNTTTTFESAPHVESERSDETSVHKPALPLIHDVSNTSMESEEPVDREVMQQRLCAAIETIQESVGSDELFIAYNPQQNTIGGISIRVIVPGKEMSERRDYLLFTDDEKYNKYAEQFPQDARIDEHSTLLVHESETYPVLHPETTSCVLFEGYIIWR